MSYLLLCFTMNHTKWCFDGKCFLIFYFILNIFSTYVTVPTWYKWLSMWKALQCQMFGIYFNWYSQHFVNPQSKISIFHRSIKNLKLIWYIWALIKKTTCHIKLLSTRPLELLSHTSYVFCTLLKTYNHQTFCINTPPPPFYLCSSEFKSSQFLWIWEL